jgi:hypothetical protein
MSLSSNPGTGPPDPTTASEGATLTSRPNVTTGGVRTPEWLGARPITAKMGADWVAKAARMSAPLLALAGSNADPAPVVSRIELVPEDRLFGDLMVAWPGDTSDNPRVVHHLPDGSFFQQLLQRCYAPILKRRPDLAAVLDDYSRLEMALTNDTLQIQLPTIPGYSMVRHHALMLFHAILWLADAKRPSMLALYDEVAGYVFEGSRPTIEQLAEIERLNGAHMVALASRSLDPQAADQLLNSPAELGRIYDGQLCAGAAIGLLWREFRALPVEQREPWQRTQLSEGYVDPEYLHRSWTEARSAR